MHRHLVALNNARLHPDVRAPALNRGRPQVLQRAGARHEVAGGILGVDARLKRPPTLLDLLLGEGQTLASRHADLPLDEVRAGEHFGDGVLHLQARVHLHEVEVLALVHDELDGAGADVVDGARGFAGRLANALARLIAEAGLWMKGEW